MPSRALLSVSDKQGVAELGVELARLGIQLLATGGTRKLLCEQGLEVEEVASYTGFPELMDGRVKSLHPKIHAGLLARGEQDEQTLAQHGIDPIDLVVANLYPFAEAVEQLEEWTRLLEYIDIGGPAMIRAAAKNHPRVAVVVTPRDYPRLLERLGNGGVDGPFRLELAARAFAHTAAYEQRIARAFAEGTQSSDLLPADLRLSLSRREELRYGENPHQPAAFYAWQGADHAGLAGARQWQGKALSYNNIMDADTAWQCVSELPDPACVIVKHANPCGVAMAETQGAAYEAAHGADPESAFGGIIAFNRELDAPTAQTLVDRQFAELIIAPALAAGALEALKRRSALRVLTASPAVGGGLDCRTVEGGLLVQERERAANPLQLNREAMQVVSRRQPEEEEWVDLLFAWQVVRHVKSNAIVYARKRRTLGIGAGQTSRLFSVRLAGLRADSAGLSVAGAVMASDAFFPFADGLEIAAEQGVQAVIQPGGSIRDSEVIAAADRAGMAMVFTGRRHFRH